MERQHPITRRALLAVAAGMIPVIRSRAVLGAASGLFHDPDGDIAAIERRVRGRIGVAAVDTGSGARVSYRADERFAMCSTFKILAVAATLKRVDQGKDRLGRLVPYGEKDLLDYAPITKQHVSKGSMTLSALCAAAIEYSDNTAANLLLSALGGPSAVTSYARSLDDSVTRLDRTEPSLNSAIAGDDRDTTTPGAMLGDTLEIFTGNALSAESRGLLIGWMTGSTTGATRLRAGVPGTWRVGDKTGTGERGATGDVGIMWPPGRRPILIVAYLVETVAPAAERNAAIRDVGRALATQFRH